MDNIGAQEMTEEYYNAAFQRMIDNPGSDSWKWIEERNDFIIPHIVGINVFDLGCGLGTIAKKISNSYIGIDFSSVAIEWAKKNCWGCSKRFFKQSFDEVGRSHYSAGTVLLLEVLEHVENLTIPVNLAKQIAALRIIVTVPVDMPGKKHFHPRWNEMMLERIMEMKASEIKIFGGEKNDRWLMGCFDMR